MNDGDNGMMPPANCISCLSGPSFPILHQYSKVTSNGAIVIVENVFAKENDQTTEQLFLRPYDPV